MTEREENDLERLLRLAADEPAHRPEFYQRLLESTVYVLGTANGGEGQTTLEAGSQVNLTQWEKQDGTSAIPFFSSLEVLRQGIEEEQSYLALTARSLFEMTEGATLYLNPRLPYGKEFVPEEVRGLLKEGVGSAPEQRTVEQDTEVLLGQPAEYPAAMVDSLTQLLAKHGNVKRAFLTLMHDRSVSEHPSLVVGIEAEGDIEPVMRECGQVIGDTVSKGKAVDLYRIAENDEGLSRYFVEQVEPFYQRRWGSRLRNFFKGGNA
ncbi:enhanced serine sensitivity protein SseB [Alcanivorax sp. 24]|uniref:enhanced serine sensitivity protein SseB n=1 Tax=Alcanivorax sp. 24 TaxID=2545266 RepID=UPI00105FF3F8|nr:enhanced serine sensitivity protein SseB [Alcanivorax sp. 24]